MKYYFFLVVFITNCFFTENSLPSNQDGTNQVINKSIDNNEAYHETRAELLLDVEKDWNYHPPSPAASPLLTTAEQEQEILNISAIKTKIHSLIIPTISLEDASLNEAIDYFQEKSRDADPLKKGVNIFLKQSENSPVSAPTKKTASIAESETLTIERHLNLELHEIPLDIALKYLAKQAGLQVKIDAYAISLFPYSTEKEMLVTQEYDIPTNFFPIKKPDSLATSSLSQETTTHSFSRLSDQTSAQEYLQAQGIEFKTGASAIYLPTSNKLIVRNTQENIDLIAMLVQAAIKSPPLQIAIETKFIEVNQNDLNELGFNWLLGPFQIGSSGLYGSGGGTTNGLNTTAYPFQTAGMNPIGALRSGSDAINNTSIDAAMAATPNSTSTSTPGIFSIGGIYSNPQFQMVIRALNQKKGVDLMAAPHVTTKNGMKALIKIVDEFIYPTHYAPPQLPQSTTNSSGNSFQQTPPTIAPSFPNAWTTKNLGVILEAKPTIAPDGKTIKLELHPQITDFDGFINYGTPINTIGYNTSIPNINAVPFSETLTTNTINQPVFTVREVNTSVVVMDGQTVVIGGLIREDIQHVEDKVPFLGDIPLAGRLFRSKVDRKLKKNLIIFVTSRIVNADGVPQHQEKSVAP